MFRQLHWPVVQSQRHESSALLWTLLMLHPAAGGVGGCCILLLVVVVHAGSCWMRQQLPAELSASDFHPWDIAQPRAHCSAEADTECIAHSGVIPEALFTHDPSKSLQSFIQRHGKLPEEKRHDDSI